MKLLYIIIFFLLLLFAPPTVYSQNQGDVKDVPIPKQIPVDESTVIFAGCRLSNLSAAYPATPEKDELDEGEDETPQDDKDVLAQSKIIQNNAIKSKYISGCFQDIIRFVIIIASLAAILKIAASGLALLDPTGSKISQNLSSKSTITNLIIGLFLLIVGWNIIPILNNSFNNVGFLNLPGISYCNGTSVCSTEAIQKQTKYFNCINRYKTIKKDKDFSENIDLQQNLEDCLRDFCREKSTFKKLDSKVCLDYSVKGSIVAKIQTLIKQGIEERKKPPATPGTPGTPVPTADCSEPEKSAKASKVGITHYKYSEATASDLVSIEGQKLHKDAAAGYTKMKEAAGKEGVNLKLLSGFRSVADQTKIVNDKRKNGKSDKDIYSSSSEPGYSEHHTGFAMDLNSLNESFGSTKEGEWLKSNVSKYGFEISFPESRPGGVKYEPWHIRFVQSNPKQFCWGSKVIK
jgi:hypothetical protein